MVEGGRVPAVLAPGDAVFAFELLVASEAWVGCNARGEKRFIAVGCSEVDGHGSQLVCKDCAEVETSGVPQVYLYGVP